MPKAIWKGHINFGLVTVPVRLYSATNRRKTEFSLVDRRDKSPVGQRRINKETGREIEPENVARAAEVDGEPVIVEDEDFERLRSELSRSIDIEHFVRLEQIEPAYFDRPYFLEPQEGGERSYALLRLVAEQTGRVGIARVVLRRREHLAALGIHDGALALNLLRYPDEVRDPTELDLPEGGLRDLGITTDAVEMATELVMRMTRDWQPARYHDEFHEALEDLIERKAKPQRHPPTPSEPPAGAPRAEGSSGDELDEQLRR
ncbi:MAG: Ku protein, partial [Persicimonas sp.]